MGKTATSPDKRTVAATRACIEIFPFALKKPAPATQATLDKAKRYCHIHRLMAPKQVSSLNRPQGFLVIYKPTAVSC